MLAMRVILILNFLEDIAMKPFKLNPAFATVLTVGTVLLVPQLSIAGSYPGQGWDVFNTGGAEGAVPVSIQYQGASLSKSGQGWDVFNAGSGAKVITPFPNQNNGPATIKPGQGWDVFNVGGTRVVVPFPSQN
jgi:hypothetical protein